MTARSPEAGRGYLYAVLGSVCGGSVPTLTKILLVNNGPTVLAGFSMLLSGLFLVLYRPRVRPSKEITPYLLFMGVVGAALAPLMYTFGISETTAVNVSLLANAEVLFTTVIAFTVLGERVARGQAARGVLIVAGLVVVSTNLDLAHVAFMEGLAGNLLVLGATLGWAVENNVIAVATKKFDASSLSKFRNLIGGGIVTTVVLAAQLPFGFGFHDVAALILLAAAIAGTTYFFIGAVERLGAIRMLLVWSTATVFGALFALVILGEQITLIQALGGALILTGVYLFHRKEGGPVAEPFAPPAMAPE